MGLGRALNSKDLRNATAKSFVFFAQKINKWCLTSSSTLSKTYETVKREGLHWENRVAVKGYVSFNG